MIDENLRIAVPLAELIGEIKYLSNNNKKVVNAHFFCPTKNKARAHNSKSVGELEYRVKLATGYAVDKVEILVNLYSVYCIKPTVKSIKETFENDVQPIIQYRNDRYEIQGVTINNQTFAPPETIDEIIYMARGIGYDLILTEEMYRKIYLKQ